MSKKPISKPKNLAKAALMSPIFRQKEHGKSNKHYDRKKEKKVDLREKILDRLNESNSNDHKNVKEEVERKSTRNVKINGEWHDEVAKKMDGTKVTHIKTRDGK